MEMKSDQQKNKTAQQENSQTELAFAAFKVPRKTIRQSAY
jgi:hypothetical protein